MSRTTTRTSRTIVGMLAMLGVALLIAWMFSVTAYGYEVDALGTSPNLRPQDVILAGGGGVLLLAAVLIPIAQRRKSHTKR